ncbi:MAG: pseudouridine synthase [Elusimicrobia bacterium]|nr:pseudouridine synthase [Elusimicrobiota bacterium]
MAVRAVLFNKPYGVVSQFTPLGRHPTLADYGIPPGLYPAGRLDHDSEGLLLLTGDGTLQNLLTEPRYRHPRTYQAQVERLPDDAALESLRRGVVLRDGKTRPAVVALLGTEPAFPPRTPPIRFRKSVPTAWLELTLTEGKNRQVRRMTAHVGHPTLRLVRVRIGALGLEGLAPGTWRPLGEPELRALKKAHGTIRLQSLSQADSERYPPNYPRG